MKPLNERTSGDSGRARATRLYEQDREEPCSPSRLETYVERWRGWVVGGLSRQDLGHARAQPFGPLRGWAGRATL